MNILGKVPGALSGTGKGTVTNMGAEIGATTSTFGYDENMDPYLPSNGSRRLLPIFVKNIRSILQSDPSVQNDPEKYYDEYYEIDLSYFGTAHIVGPHTPDLRPRSFSNERGSR